MAIFEKTSVYTLLMKTNLPSRPLSGVRSYGLDFKGSSQCNENLTRFPHGLSFSESSSRGAEPATSEATNNK